MEVGQQTSHFPSGFLFLLGYVLLRLFVRCVRSVCCSWGFWGVWALPAEAVMGEHSFLSGRWWWAGLVDTAGVWCVFGVRESWYMVGIGERKQPPPSLLCLWSYEREVSEITEFRSSCSMNQAKKPPSLILCCTLRIAEYWRIQRGRYNVFLW